MAIRDDFFAALTKGARWDVGVSIKRSNPLPLDDKSVFGSYADLEAYAAGVLAYPGQVVAVVEEAKTVIYYLDQNLEIQPVGIIPTGDNKTIEVTEAGKISLMGAAEAKAGQQPRIVNKGTEAEPKLELEWYTPDNSTVAGLQENVGALQTTVDGEVEEDGTVTKEGLVHKVAGLQDKVGKAAEGEAAATGLYKEIADEKARAMEVEEDLQSQIDAIDYVDADELATALEPYSKTKDVNDGLALKADKETTYTKTEVDEAIDAVADDLAAAVEDLEEQIGAIEVPVEGVADGEKIISLTNKKLATTLSIAKTKKDDGKTYVQLIGKDGAIVSEFDAAEFIADGMLESVTKDEANNTIVFKWNTTAGKSETTIDIDELVEVYEAGNGIDITDFVISVKRDATSEDFLTVGVDGIKLSGVQDAINTAEQNAKDYADDLVDGVADDLAALAEDVNANADAIATLIGTGEGSVAKAIADAIDAENLDQYATDDDLNTYKGQMETALAGKADKADIIDAYTKTEADAKFQAAADATAKVASDLSTYETANDARVKTVEDKLNTVEENSEKNIIEAVKVEGVALTVNEEDRSVNVTRETLGVYSKTEVDTAVAGANAAAAAAEAQADKGVADAAAAQSTANDAKAVGTANSGKILALEKTVNGWVPEEGEQGEEITGLTAQVANHETRLGAAEGTIAGHTTQIGEINTALAGKADQSDLNATNGRVTALEDTVNNEATGLVKKVGDNANAIADLDERLTAEEAKVDNDTTYTFENGAEGTFKVTAKGGEAQTIDTGAKAYADAQIEAATKDLATKEEAQGYANAKVASVTAADASVTIGGTTTAPTVAVKLSADADNELTLAEDGLKVVIPAAAEYSIVKAADSGDYAAIYNLTKDGAIVGASINIPKDMVVKSGSVVGDEIVLVLNDKDSTEIKIPVASLIEYVTSGSNTGDMVVVNVSDDHKVTATITDGTVTLAKLTTEVQTAIGKAHAHGNIDVIDAITADDVEAWDAAEQNAKDYADGLAGNYATAAQGAKADTAVQTVEAGTGLKVTKALAEDGETEDPTKVTVEIDDSVVFVFDGGSASSEW